MLGLQRFEARRAQMRKDLRLYTGGEDDFCHRLYRNPDGSFTDFHALDRRKLKALNVEPALSEGSDPDRGPRLHDRRGAAYQH